MCFPRAAVRVFVGREQEENVMQSSWCVYIPTSSAAGGSEMEWGRAPISLDNSEPK